MTANTQLLAARPALVRLVDRLEQEHAQLQLEPLLRLLADCPIAAHDLEPFIRFDAAGYHDEPILIRPDFELRCLSWKSGQHTAIHDHVGSLCGMRVIHGTLTNIDYQHTRPGYVTRGAKFLLHAGDLLGRQHTDTHVVGNGMTAGQDVITLHVYTPPLSTHRSSAFAQMPGIRSSSSHCFLGDAGDDRA